MHLWDRLVQQANITLNMMRTCRLHPHLSAYEILYGAYTYNSMPMAPLGCRALILQHPSVRASWDTHALDAWYIGPAVNHYRCYEFYVPKTRGTRTTETVKFKPHNCEVPFLSDSDCIVKSIEDLTSTLQKKQTNTSQAMEALETLKSTLVRHATASPRVKTPKIHQPVPLLRVYTNPAH